MDALTSNAPPREYADGKMLAAKDGGIGFITFNQPEKRNAMSVEMWQGLAEILDDFREDAAVRVVIMTGAGGKAFVSGADISQFEKRRANADAQEEYARLTSGGRAPCRPTCASPRRTASSAFRPRASASPTPSTACARSSSWSDPRTRA